MNIQSIQIKSRSIAWSIWFIASLFYAYQYILRVMPNIMMNELLQQFNIDSATFGQFSGVYYIGYSLMHLPIGILLDRFGPKKIMPLCMIITSIGLLPILFSDYWVYPVIGRALIGMGSSAAILGTFKIIRLSFSESKFTRLLSFSVTIGLIGAIYGGGPVQYMCDWWGYQMVTAVFAISGIILSIISYFMIPKIKTESKSSIMADLKTVFSSAKVWIICVFAGLMVGPLEGFADVWGSEYLKQVYGIEANIAARLTSLIFVGMCFGAPVLSTIAEKIGGSLKTIIAAGIIMALAFFWLLSGNVSVTQMSIMFIVVGICCAYQIIAIYKASTYVPDNVVGLTTAVANMIIMIFGYFFHTIIGWAINITGGVTTPSAFTYGVSVIPIAVLLGVIGFLAFWFCRETRVLSRISGLKTQ